MFAWAFLPRLCVFVAPHSLLFVGTYLLMYFNLLLVFCVAYCSSGRTTYSPARPLCLSLTIFPPAPPLVSFLQVFFVLRLQATIRLVCYLLGFGQL